MKTMLQGAYESVLRVQDQSDFREEIIRFANGLGFGTVTAMLVFDHALGDSEFISIDNAPSNFHETFKNLSMGRVDPVMQHCKRHSLPIIWNQRTYVDCGQGELWEEQAKFGLCAGIALALHLPEGRHFCLGVDRDQALPSDPASLTQIVAELQLFAVHAQESAWHVFTPQGSPAAQFGARLTPRELECLRWTMEGKTAWEVGTILSISERTAVLHLNNAMHKLECNNKHQAVLKALRLGLIR
ncbi:autoinducer binding domain-containing protein [Paucibacter sp. APW11]|uniref:Autoinducer binding domain-containing protein n=1 Tax=Roseateles aquae TaxID=3077235 RepID=A0ABU3PGF0_9BURK|nr:autoinducer binding domain-containing protein [Paucibacter sp. APW11]MDT9001616.1 autoinducer binding domain-containing protein [Paucibacter sp. APW11]